MGIRKTTKEKERREEKILKKKRKKEGREKRREEEEEEKVKDRGHDGPKSSGGMEESRRHKTSYSSVTCAFNGRSQRKMAAISPPRPSNRGYLPLCYDSKTPLALSFHRDL